MRDKVLYLWEKIEKYEDKTSSIVDIFSDAQLAVRLALQSTQDIERTARLAKLLEKFDEVFSKTPFFGFNLFQLHNWWRDIQDRNWQDKISYGNKQIDYTEIQKWCWTRYNDIRFDILKENVVDVGIGSSGVQVEGTF